MSNTCEICGTEDLKTWKRCDEHYRCDDCGTAEGLCTYCEGVLCDTCHRARVDDRIAAFNGDTDYTSEITCPHCGYVKSDSFECDEGRHQCEDCENEYEVTRDVEVTYCTMKAS